MPVTRGIALRRVLFLARAEVLHVVRDRATLVQIIVMPVIQLLILSNVATFTVKNTPAYVVDFDHTTTSRGLVTRLGASGDFRIIGQSGSPDMANEAMLRGTVTMVLTIPNEFETSLVRTGSAPVHLDMNAEKGSAAGIAASYATQIISAYSEELSTHMHPTPQAIDAGNPEIPPVVGTQRIDVRFRGLYNPTLNYKYYMVPGILVQLVTMIGTLLTAQNIAREKEAGTLEQINVTPITKRQFIAAKLLPFWVLALADLAIGLTVGHFVFGVPVRGSLLLYFGAAAIYLVAALGIGLWISTLVDTQQQAMFITFFFIMVYMLMSGLFTPIDSMPGWVQVVSEFDPVRHFATISRAVLMKGAGLREVARPLGILVVYAAAILTLAVRQYSKRTA
jgi:ABC-2 type transport system permease protein